MLTGSSGPAAGLVMAGGCFDILHYGHLLHLYQARIHGTRLVVALTADRYVNKGPGRPVFGAEQRAAMLAALRCVDEVIVSDAPRPDALIQKLRPQVYAKGIDYRDTRECDEERRLVEAYGGRIVFTDTPKFSSSELLKGGL